MAIRVGVIGAGRIGRATIESLAGFSDVQVAAVCDSDRALAEEAARPFEAGVHINFRNLIEDEHLDAVFVSLPAFSLGEPEMLAARAGIHLFVEPPVALNEQKAREVQREIEKAGVVASVGYTWRYLSGAVRLKEMLKDRKVAMISGCRHLEVPTTGWRRRREASGGLFLQAATYLVDIMRHLVGDITAVYAMAYEGIAAAKAPEYDIEDACGVMLGFRSGAVGQILCSSAAPHEDESSVSVYGDGFEATLTDRNLEIVLPGKLTRESHNEPGLRQAHAAFLEAVQHGKPGLVRSTYADAVTTLQVALATRESIQAGKTVAL